MNRYSSTRQYWAELITVSILLIIMTVYLVFKTPIIFVPNSIVTQWDSIWLDHMPQPCAQNNILCGPKEFLGCVKIERDFLGGWTVAHWAPAHNQKLVPLALTGECDSSYNASWHIHPAGLDSTGQFRYFPDLSGSDLQSIIHDPIIAGIMTYKPGKMVAAIKWRGHLVYPVRVQ